LFGAPMTIDAIEAALKKDFENIKYKKEVKEE
jgi:hypothetical protein